MVKKTYEKPKVSKVALKTSEAVLTACKAPRGDPNFRRCRERRRFGGNCYTVSNT